MRPSRIKDKFSRVFSKFSQNCSSRAAENFPRTLKHNQPALRMKVPARKNSPNNSLTVAQRTEQERLTIMYILREIQSYFIDKTHLKHLKLKLSKFHSPELRSFLSMEKLSTTSLQSF